MQNEQPFWRPIELEINAEQKSKVVFKAIFFEIHVIH